MKTLIAVVTGVALVLASGPVVAQEKATDDKYVSKEDYQKLKAEHDKLQQEMETLKTQMQQLLQKGAAPASAEISNQVQQLQKKAEAQQTETDQALEALDKDIKAVKQMAKDAFPGTTKMLLAGYGSGTFTATSKGYGPSQPLPPDSRDGRNFFTATFNPIFLWKASDRLLFEGELELELEGSDTTVALEMAHL